MYSFNKNIQNKGFSHVDFALLQSKKNIIEKKKKESDEIIDAYEKGNEYVLCEYDLSKRDPIEILKMTNEWAEAVFPAEIGYMDAECTILATGKDRIEVTAFKYRMFNDAKSEELKYIPKNMPFYKFEELMDELCLSDSLVNAINKIQLNSLKEIKGKIANHICRRMYGSDNFYVFDALHRKSDYTKKQIQNSLLALMKKEVVLVSKNGNYYINKTVFENVSGKLMYEEQQKVNWDKWIIENKKEKERMAIGYKINRRKRV